MLKRLLPLIILTLVSACASSETPNAGPPSPQGSAASASAATAWRPEVGGCHDLQSLRISVQAYSAVDCAKSHIFQTVHVGEVSGPAANAAISPELGTPEYLEIWRDCDQRLAAFFGGAWRDFRLKLRVSFPAASAWDAAARWYSCETAVYEDYKWTNTPTTGSLEGGAGRLAELKLGCYQSPAKTAVPVTAKLCTEPHNLEFVGTYEMAVPWSAIETGGGDLLYGRCRELIDTFAGPSASSGVAAWHAFEDDWKAGNRGIRCFLWLQGRQVSKSLKRGGA